MHGTRPDLTDAAAEMLRLGRARRQAGDVESAKALFAGAANAKNDCAAAYHELSSIASGPGRYDAAIALARRALALEPDSGATCNDLGLQLWKAQRYDEAEPVLLRAAWLLDGHPNYGGVLQNLGLLCYATGRAAEAISYFERALALKPDDLWCRNDLAHAVLKSGDLRRGFELYEVRWDLLEKSAAWDCGLPKWRGERIERALLLHAEQGFGDTVNFVRFIPFIKECSGATRVILAAPRALIRLLDRQCGIDAVIDIESPGAILRAAREADYHCPLLSAFAAIEFNYDTLPAARPYLTAPAEASCRRSFHDGGARLAVGIVWAAGQSTEYGAQKSVPIGDMLELATIPGVRLWSLQMGAPVADAVATGADCLMTDAMTGVADFADTAAIMQKLDVVVSVCSAPAHLAGALGKPCFLLNSVKACWRWCNGAAPWYSTVELFDQDRTGDWRAPIAAIKRRLAEMAETVARAA
jgi:Tfp pilus assembly protein PilF